MIGKLDGAGYHKFYNRIEENILKSYADSVPKDEPGEEGIKSLSDEYISKDREEEKTGLYKIVNDENRNKKNL